ncbi:MAG: MFS transporter, partial [Elusimicrobia bacterium]|nr:MFS transporter [Elusimicrobiota bacterium]
CRAVLVAGFALSFPFLALYLNHERGISMGWIGVFVAVNMLGRALGQLWGGRLADAYGRKRVMVCALFGRGILIFGSAWLIFERAPLMPIVGSHILHSFVGSFFEPASMAWVSDIYKSHERSSAYSFLRVAANLGWAVGPALGGILASHSYAAAFLATSALTLLCGALLYGWLEETPPSAARTQAAGAHTPRLGAILADERLFRCCLHLALLSAAMAQIIVTFSVHCVRFVGLSEFQVGILFSINGLWVVCLQYWATQKLIKFRLTGLMGIGCLILAVGFGMISLAHTFGWLAAAVSVYTFGEILVAPSQTALVANMSPPHERGRYLGAAGLAQQVGGAAGPLLGGLALEALGPRWPGGLWVIAGAACLLSAWQFERFKAQLTPAEDGLGFPLPIRQGEETA